MAALVWVCFTLNGSGSPSGSVREHNTCITESYMIYTDWRQIQTLAVVFTTDNCDFNFTCQYHEHCETMVQSKHFEGKHSYGNVSSFNV